MKQSSQFSRAEIALGEWSRERAESELQNVTGGQLAAAISDFIEWRAFSYWVRLMHECGRGSATQIKEVLEERCPGFLAMETAYREAHPREPEFRWLRLVEWIDGHVFDCAESGGWRHALGYYATRDERLDRVRAWWLKCDEEWKQQTPGHLPDFDEWRERALAGH